MRQDERVAFDRALLSARLAAYPPGEFIGQESFMRAGEILALARRAGIAAGVSVLDVCCGVAGPGRFLTRELGCDYLGVDYSASALAIARERAADLACRFAHGHVPPLPPGNHDVVLLLETMLAFPDKDVLMAGIASALRPGGRLAFTLEEGDPLSDAERASMPDADTVWPVPLPDLVRILGRNGLRLVWWEDCSRSHQTVVDALLAAYAADGREIARLVGRRALEELVAAHRLWSDWLRTGRVRKLALVAERPRVPVRERAARTHVSLAAPTGAPLPAADEAVLGAAGRQVALAPRG